MAYQVEFTDEFETWWNSLREVEQEDVSAGVELLETHGPALGRPYVDTIKGSKHANMKELRVQHAGQPYRILFAFNPQRTALLLVGGNKTGDDRWYKTFVPVGDKLYDQHLEELARERKQETGDAS